MKSKYCIAICIALILLISTGFSLVGCCVGKQTFNLICQIPVFVSAKNGKAWDERIRKRMESGRLMKMPDTTVAYNVDDMSDEKPDISGINDWDELYRS